MEEIEITAVKLDTQPAEISLKSLRQELKALKDQMAGLEEGSDAFLECANKAGTLKHQIDEISQSVNGASADFGDMLGNVSKVATGIIGSFQAAKGALTLFGVESEEVTKAIQKMQASMAIVQGMNSIDQGIKALDKLRNSITATTNAAKLLKSVMTPAWILAIIAAVTGLISLIKKWTTGMKELKEQQEEFQKSLSEIKNSSVEESQKIQILNNLIRDNGVSLEYRKKALTDLKSVVKDYKGDLTDEGKLLNDNVSAIEDYCNALEKQIRIKLYSEEIQKLYKQQLENELEIEKKRSEAERLRMRVDGTDASQGVTTVQMKLWDVENEITTLEKKNQNINNQIATIYDKIRETSEGYVYITNSETDANKASTEAINKRKQAIDEYINQLQIAQAKYKALYAEKEKPLVVSKPELPDYGEEDEDFTHVDKIMQRLNHVKDTYAILRQTDLEYYEQAQKDLETLYKNKQLSDEEYATAKKNIADDISEYEKQKQMQTAAYAASGLSALSTMLASFSELCDKNTQEGFEQYKKLQISSAIMSTLSGVIAAWTSAMALPAPASFILGAMQSAATAAMGAAQVSNIQKQTFGTASTLSTSTISTNAINSIINTPVQYTNAIQGANIESAIKDQRVYVTEYDISKTQEKVQVSETESRY